MPTNNRGEQPQALTEEIFKHKYNIFYRAGKSDFGVERKMRM